MEFRPFATGGVYVNLLVDATEETAKASHSAEQDERLATLKRKYDLTNFFRMNHNIALRSR